VAYQYKAMAGSYSSACGVGLSDCRRMRESNVNPSLPLPAQTPRQRQADCETTSALGDETSTGNSLLAHAPVLFHQRALAAILQINVVRVEISV